MLHSRLYSASRRLLELQPDERRGVVDRLHPQDAAIVEHAIRNFRFSSFGFDVVDTGLSDCPDEQKWVGVLATMIVAALTNAQTVTASAEMP